MANPALASMSRAIRRWIVEGSYRANVGHIGSALSIADIMAVLWGSVMRKPGTQDPERDRFLLGKGHAALAMYAAMRWCKVIDDAAFGTYCRDGSALGQHPEALLPGVELSTGSLGQAISVGAGLAYGLRARKNPGRVFVLLSDGECDEGQTWEAALFAGHHKLSGLVAVVDANGLQCMGRTGEVLDTEPLLDKWRAFRWDAVEADGHDLDALERAFQGAGSDGRPRVVVARTVQGKGVSFMENKLEWHYVNLSAGQYDRALEELPPP